MKKTSKPVKASRKLIKRVKQERAINQEVVQPPVAQTPDDALPAKSVVVNAPEQLLKEEAVQPAVSKMVDAALDVVAQSAASAPLDHSLSLWAQAGTAGAAVDAGAGAGAAAGTGASTAAGAAAATTTTAAVATGAALSTGAVLAGVAAVGVAAAAGGGGGGSTQAPAAPTDTTAPVVALTAATDDVGSVTGALASGARTDDTALVLSGTTEAGATVKVYNGATFLGNATVTGTNWTYTATVVDGTTYQFNAKATDAAGNVSAATSNFTVTGDTTAPVIASLVAHSATKTIELTYGEALDGTNIPLPASFVVTTGGAPNTVTTVSVAGAVMTLTLQDAFTPGAVTVIYNDPAAGNDVNAIQDAAGNDAAGFTQGLIADGYLRDATVYIDTNGNGVANPGIDYLVGTTDDGGNFFIPAGAPTGTIIAVGGVNIDTGVANTTALKAPAGSTTINPLTTLVQAVVDASGGTTTAEAAATSVATSLGLTGLGGQSLLNYDPISAGNVDAQKAAAQVATIVALAESASAGAGSQVITNLATVVSNAGAAPVVLADASTISTILPAVVQSNAIATSAISDASTSIGNAASISAISTAQSQALDTIAPSAPTSLSVAVTTNDTTPSVRVNFNTAATNGTAAVAGDTITLRENGAQAGTAVTLTAADIAAGFKLVDASSLSDGSHTLSAVLTDQAGNVSAVATGVVVNIDTQAPAAPVINTVATDDVINSSEQTAVVSGLAEANATVSLSIGGNTRTATANGSGNWSYTLQAGDITAMGQGVETLSATATDAAGNTSAAGARAISVDTTAPTATAPVTSGAAIISDNTPTLNGTIVGSLGAGEVVAVYDGASRLGLATVSGSSWIFNTPSLSNAAHSFTAKVEDAAGNSGSAGTAYVVTVNATVPTATATITTMTDDVAENTGNIASGGISNDSMPVLGGAVVGTLGADSVVIYDGATRLGAATVTGTSWSYTPSALSAGAHSFTAVVETNAGNQGAMSTAYGLTLDFTAPNAAVINPVAIDNVVNAAEKGAGIVVTGTAEAGSAVAVTWGAALKPATATGGVWSVTFASGEVPADNVSSTISATVTDTAGNAGVAATRTVLIDSTGPSAQFDLVGTTSVTGNPNIAINSATTITGTTEANAKLALTVGSGNIRSLTANGSGVWSYQLSATDIKAMGQGSETLSVTATDAAGNSGTAATQAITIDTTAPVLTAFSIADASDSGIKGDGRSNVGAPTISFTAEAGATLAIDSGSGGYVAAGVATGSAQTLTKPSPFLTDGTYVINLKATDAAGNFTVRTANYTFDSSAPSAPAISGIADNVGSVQGNLADNARTDDTQLVISGTAEAYATVTVYNGATVLGTAAANASGNWTYTTPALTDAAPYVFSAKATDVAGNQSAASVTTTVTIDTTPPVAPAVALATDSGLSASDGITNVGTINVTGIEPGASWQYSTNSGGSFSTGTGTSFTLAAGNYAVNAVQVKQTDVAGNAGVVGGNSAAFNIDATAPAAPSIALATDSGTSQSDGITNVGTVNVTGVEPGATWQYSTDGGANYSNGTGTSFTLTAASYATGSIKVRQIDVAGNISAAIGNAADIVVDQTVPTATAAVTGADDNIAPTTGNLNSGDTTNDPTLGLSGTITGTLTTGDVVSVYDGATRLGLATIGVNGSTWSFTTATLSNTAHNFTARVEDAAGNQGSVGTPYVVTVNASVPTATATITGAADDVAAITGNVAPGGTSNDSTPTLSGAVVGTLAAGEVVAIYDGATKLGNAAVNAATWSYTPSALSGGAHSFTAVVESAVGNQGTVSTAYALTLDLTAPATLAGALASDTGASASDGITSVGTINVTGIEVGATWQYSTNGGTTFTTGTGTSFTLAAGNYAANALQVKQTDAAGNTSLVFANTGAITVDATAPVAPAVALATDSGSGATDGITNVGTINVTGLESGATWQYSTNGGTSFTAGTGTSFNLAAGTYAANAVQVKQTDVAGNTGVVGGNAAAITLDTAAPSAPGIALATDSGASPSDGITNVATVNVTGLESGASWQYSTNGGTTFTIGTGTSFALVAGTYAAGAIQVKQTDVAGNVGAVGSIVGSVTVDTAAPATLTAALASDTGASASDGVTNVGTINVTGIEPGATWQYSTNSGSSFSAGTGTSFTLAAGTYAANAVQIKQTDVAGNVSTVYSNDVPLTIDATTPAAPGIALASDTGASASDGVTNVGTVNVTGVEPGATWQYSTDGGANYSNGTGTSFTLTAASYATGSIKVRQIDVAGNISAAIGNAADIVVDQTVPTATAAVTGADDNIAPTTGNLNSGDTTNDPTLGLSGTITGTLTTGDVVSVYDGATRLGLATIGVNGSTWSFTTATLSNTAHNFTARVEDAAGNQGSVGTPYVVTVNASVPTATATITGAADDVAAITGNVAPGGTSNDSTPTLSGAVVGTLAAGEVVAIYDGATKLGNAAVNAATWSYTPSALSGGAHSFTAVVESAVGNQGTVSTAYALTLDLTAPATLAGALASDTGASASDGITSVGTINVTGIEVGATWQYSTNGGTTFTTGTGTSFTLAAGNYAANALQVKQTDAAGNTSLVFANTGAITVDATAPVAPAVALATDSGSGATDGITNVGTINVTGLESGATWQYSTNGGTSFTAGTGTSFNLAAGTYAANAVQVKQTDVAGNTGVVGGNAAAITLDTAAPSAPGIALATDSGASPSDGITNVATVNVTGLESGASWQYSTNGGTTFTTGTGTSFALVAGTYAAGAIQVKQTDVAGNVGAVGSIVGSVTVDSTAPATLAAALASDTGSSASDGVTNVGTINVTGIEPGAIWQYSTNSGGSFSAGTGTSFTLAAGTYAANAVQIKQTDVAGNVSTVYSNGAPLTIDATAPATPGIALASDTGASASDGVTNVGTVNVTGVEPGATWQYSTNGGTSFTNGAGTSFNLGAGIYAAGSIQVKQTDLAGNTGSVASIAAATSVDLTAPTPTSVVVNGATLTLTFNEALDSLHTPLASSLNVLVNGVSRAVTNAVFSEATATLTLASAVTAGETVTLSYTDPTAGDDVSALQDLAGSDVASGAAIPVINQTPPTLNASLLDNVTNLEVGSNIVLNFNTNVIAASAKYIHIINDGGAGFRGESTVNTLDILVTDTSQVTIVGGKVTINPTADLDLANNYHITIDAGAFTASASGAAMAAYDGTTTLNFSTVTPGATALVNAAASQVMNADGTLASGHLWLDIEGIGSRSMSAGTQPSLDLSANNYALVAKDYDAAGGSPGYDGVTTADFYVAANNFGAGDLIYIDNQSVTSNDLTQTGIVNYGTPPTLVPFAGTGLGGQIDISLANSSTAVFDTFVPTLDAVDLKTLLGTTTSPVISA